MMKTYEELLAAQTELAHFNPNHDPDNGQFTDKKVRRGSKNVQPDKPSDISEQIKNKRLEDAYGAGLKTISDPNGTKDNINSSSKQKKMLSVATAAAIAAVGITAGIVLAHRMHATEKIKTLLNSGTTDKEDFKDVMTEAIDDESEVLKQGAKISRISFTPGEDITSSDDIAFATYKPKDKATYMTLLKDFAKSGNGKRVMTYETIKDMKIPTEEKARKIFEALWNENPKYQESLKQTIRSYIRDTVPGYKDASDESIDKVSQYGFGKNSSDMFYKGIWAMVRRGEDSKIFTDALKKEGYDAIRDYHDIYDKVSEAPLILLDPKSSMVKKGEEAVTKATKMKTMKGLLKAGEKCLPTESPDLWPINNGEGRLDIKKLMDAVKRGLI